jgi:hypothetical protein
MLVGGQKSYRRGILKESVRLTQDDGRGEPVAKKKLQEKRVDSLPDQPHAVKSEPRPSSRRLHPSVRLEGTYRSGVRADEPSWWV